MPDMILCVFFVLFLPLSGARGTGSLIWSLAILETRVDEIQFADFVDNFLEYEVVGQGITWKLLFVSAFAVDVESVVDERQWSYLIGDFSVDVLELFTDSFNSI